MDIGGLIALHIGRVEDWLARRSAWWRSFGAGSLGESGWAAPHSECM